MNATLALRPFRRSMTTIVALAVVAATLTVAVGEHLIRVIVSAADDRAAAEVVTSVGGRVETAVPLIGGVIADVPAGSLDRISSLADVVPDRALHVRSGSFEGSPGTAFPYEVGAPDVWSETAGQGVGVALVDTGVAPVPDLLDRVVAVADLTPEHTMTDGFGHGTFMAGLIAGNGTASEGSYLGVAPKAQLVSVKVAVSDGSTTLGTVLAGLQLVDHSRARFNIRVLLLALSSDTDVAPSRDPLTRALRALWSDGIFVVVPAGNDGPDEGSVDSPGQDPVLMTAGAVDDQGTPSVADDTVPSWTSRGPRFGPMKPDVAAPGTHLVSLRAPGSTIDRANPSARVGEMYFRGSGTSMSSAVTAGAAALVASAHPGMTPDDIKASLIEGATPLDGAPRTAIGAGVVNAANAVETDVSDAHGRRGGRGDPPPGSPAWDGRIWDGRVWDGRVWDGRVWDGRVWDGRVWDGRVWNSRIWG